MMRRVFGERRVGRPIGSDTWFRSPRYSAASLTVPHMLVAAVVGPVCLRDSHSIP
jgi:hypothetical protein